MKIQESLRKDSGTNTVGGGDKKILSSTIAENVGITGIKQVCERKTNLFRRLVWIVALTAMTGWLTVQFYESITTYLMHETSVSKTVVSPEHSTFPAITLCNVNPLKARAIYVMENNSYQSPTLYESITEFYRILQPSPAVKDGQTEARKHRFLKHLAPYLDRISPRQLFTSASHKATDFIYKCTWNGKTCSPKDFVPTLTDSGMCYTFNKNSTLYTEPADSKSGLNLILSLEPWDYIRGPQATTGALIYIHDQSDIPSLVSTMGQTIVSGTWTTVRIRESKELNLPPPYGTCGKGRLNNIPRGTPYTTNNCLIDRLTTHLAQTCGCVHPYTEKPAGRSYCTFSEMISCSKKEHDKESILRSGQCILPCDITKYDVTVSQVEFSERYSKTNRMEDGVTLTSTWSEKPDKNPLFIQSWMFLNEMDPALTNAIWNMTGQIYDTLEKGNDVTSDISIFIEMLDRNSSVYTSINNFNETLDLKLHMNVNAKNCGDLLTVRRCMAAQIASEQLQLFPGAMETCTVNHMYLESIENDFKKVEDIVSLLSDNLRHRGAETSTPNEHIEGSLERSAVVADQYKVIQEKMTSLFMTMETLDQMCQPFRNDIRNFWDNFDFGRKEIVNMIRNPGAHLMKVDFRREDSSYTEIRQTEAYPWLALIGDIGGTLGLCLGGSILTFVEIVDVIVTWFLNNGNGKRNQEGMVEKICETRDGPGSCEN